MDSTREERARDLFRSGLHCSQASFAAFAGDIGMDIDTAIGAGACLGGGMCKGEVCGACTGALMALGMMFGREDPAGQGTKDRCKLIARELLDRFAEENGSYLCSEILGCDMATDEGRAHARENGLFAKVCTEKVGSAVRIASEIAEREGGKERQV